MSEDSSAQGRRPKHWPEIATSSRHPAGCSTNAGQTDKQRYIRSPHIITEYIGHIPIRVDIERLTDSRTLGCIKHDACIWRKPEPTALAPDGGCLPSVAHCVELDDLIAAPQAHPNHRP